ncbi:hypothetical protein Slin14017_G086160 [Septoria linicola]|nr:hypothetical protein Slin14017_G086160 [Septoria linicola]
MHFARVAAVFLSGLAIGVQAKVLDREPVDAVIKGKHQVVTEAVSALSPRGTSTRTTTNVYGPVTFTLGLKAWNVTTIRTLYQFTVSGTVYDHIDRWIDHISYGTATITIPAMTVTNTYRALEKRAEPSATPAADPMALLDSALSATQNWPSIVSPYMMPTASPLAVNCRKTVKGWHKLSWTAYDDLNSTSHAGKKRSEELPQLLGDMQIALVNGTLIDYGGRIGSIVANHQFQFDGPPQAGSIFTAGWSLCDSAVGPVLAHGGQFGFFVCGYANNIYNTVVDNTCGRVYLGLLEASGSLDSTTSKTLTTKGSTDIVSAVSMTTKGSMATPYLPTRGLEKEKIDISLVKRADEDVLMGDTPYSLNYILTTKTWVEKAQIVTEDAYEGEPATIYTLPGGTFVATLHPATFAAPAAATKVKRDETSPINTGISTMTTTQYVSTVIVHVTETPSDLSPATILSATASNGTLTSSETSSIHGAIVTAPAFSSGSDASYFTKTHPLATIAGQICKINGSCFPSWNVTTNSNFTTPLTAFSANLTGLTFATTSTSTSTFHSTHTTTTALARPSESVTEEEVKLNLTSEEGRRVDMCGFICGWIVFLLIWGTCHLIYTYF